MFCTECGKQNPDQARFCAFCGSKLVVISDEQLRAIEGKFEPDINSGSKRPVRSPDTGERASIPPSGNRGMPEARANPSKPAQSGVPKTSVQRTAPVSPGETRALPQNRQGVPPATNARSSNDTQGKQPIPGSSAKSARAKPPAPAGGNPYERPKEPANAPPPKPITHRPPQKIPTSPHARPQDESGVSKPILYKPPGGVRMSPQRDQAVESARKPPVKQSFKRPGEAPNTLVPERKKVQATPLKPPKDYDYGDYDEDEDDGDDSRVLRRRIISLAAGSFLLIAFVVAFWLIATSPGQVFRASVGLNAPAEAYKLLGDRERQNGQLAKAAEAYYDAFAREPTNFQYTLLAAQTQEIVGNLERAEKAYWKCIELNDTQPEPYRLLALLYDRQGETAKQTEVKRMGYEKTNDPSLAPDAQN